MLYFAFRTLRPASKAAAPTVPNEPVTEEGPIAAGEQLHQIRLDLLRLSLPGDPEAL